MAVSLELLNKNMKLLRTSIGISQEELAGIIHLTRTTYCAYETGVKPPDLQTLDALAALYNISFDSLINYDLSEGLLHRVCFTSDNEEMKDLLNAYQGLSVSSKFLISQKLDVLLEKEDCLYRNSLIDSHAIKK